jgi:hypothetical protein
MPPSQIALCVAAVLGCSGCTLAAQVTGSSVVGGDAHGGAVSHVTTYTRSGALNMANTWCGQYNLIAEATRFTFINDGMDFACVPPPG